jgi:GNAT superfamily N-acetyltransferase
MHSAPPIQLISHRPGAPGLRLGLGPGLRPRHALRQLQGLLDQHSFWAQGRSTAALGQMLRGSAAAVSAWQAERLVGFGRASSDRVYRAVLWDVVVAADQQGLGLGRAIVETLLHHRELASVERIYLMTSNSSGFYGRLGFTAVPTQQLLLKSRSGEWPSSG